MRFLRWMMRRQQPLAPHGWCAHCTQPLVLCERCRGAWRGRVCPCGIGLVCSAHRGYWS